MTAHLRRRKFVKLLALSGASVGLTSKLSAFGQASGDNGQIKKIGIIGLDTSHAPAFVKAVNGAHADPAFSKYRFVAAYPKGSNDIPSSVERIPEFTKEVEAYGVEIVSSIQELLRKVDYVCLETNDGRLHLQQALPVLKARKPVFIDKPLAASLKDGMAIFEAAKKYKTPVFSSSSLRYITGMDEVLSGKYGKIVGADTYSPCKLEKTHSDLFWYGIHGVEMLFAIMGPECQSVVRVHTPGTDMVVGTWSGNRVGSFRGTRAGVIDYGGNVFGEKGNTSLGAFKGYAPLLKEIIQFFETGIAPVKDEETLAILAFMEAAEESKRKGGVPVAMHYNLKK